VLTTLGVMERFKMQCMPVPWLCTKSAQTMVTHEKCMGDGYVGRVCGQWLCMKNAHVMVEHVKNVQVMAMQTIDGKKNLELK